MEAAYLSKKTKPLDLLLYIPLLNSKNHSPALEHSLK